MAHGDGKARILDAAADVIGISVRALFPDLDRRGRARGVPSASAPMAKAAPGVTGRPRESGPPPRRRRTDRDGPD
jgi:hypothetical protein